MASHPQKALFVFIIPFEAFRGNVRRLVVAVVARESNFSESGFIYKTFQ